MLSSDQIQRIICHNVEENAYLVCPEGRDDAFIVDPGDDLKALRSAIEASGRRLCAILLTHGHFDHMLGAKPLADETGAAVYIHADDAEMLSDGEKSAAALFGSRIPQPDGVEHTTYGDTVEVCGLRLMVLSTPGHTRGGVCLYDADGGVLFTGDTLFSAGFGRTDLYGGSSQALRRSLRTLFALPGDTDVFPGHGPSTTIAAERRRYGL